MIRLRLQRRGRKNRPYYHLVVADQRSPRDGRVIERLGRFDNVSENKQLILDEERIIHWLKVGAQPSDTVRSLLKKEGLMYRMHLIRWGKSDEEIEKAMAEWREERGGLEMEAGESRKARQKAMLEAEQKAYQKELDEKAAEAARQAEAERAAKEEEKAAAAAEESASDPSEPEVKQEEVAETQAAEQETAREVDTDTAEEAGTAAEPEVKKVDAAKTEAPAEQADAEGGATKSDASEPEVKQEEAAETAPAEEQVASETPSEPGTASEPETQSAEKSEASSGTGESASGGAGTSTDMTANDAIEHIKNTPLSDLEGFITESEDRVTVLRAWEAKQSESESE